MGKRDNAGAGKSGDGKRVLANRQNVSPATLALVDEGFEVTLAQSEVDSEGWFSVEEWAAMWNCGKSHARDKINEFEKMGRMEQIMARGPGDLKKRKYARAK